MKKKVNRSCTYLMPLVFNYFKISSAYRSVISNTYVEDSIGKYENCFFIRYNIKEQRDTEALVKLESVLTSVEEFIDIFNIEGDLVYVMRMPNMYIDEYNFYKQGKYSLFSKESKEIIIKFWEKYYSNNLNAKDFLIKVQQVLFKKKALREKLERELSGFLSKIKIDSNAELGEMYDSDFETIHISK